MSSAVQQSVAQGVGQQQCAQLNVQTLALRTRVAAAQTLVTVLVATAQSLQTAVGIYFLQIKV